jgi:hypothetical protein
MLVLSNNLYTSEGANDVIPSDDITLLGILKDPQRL